MGIFRSSPGFDHFPSARDDLVGDVDERQNARGKADRCDRIHRLVYVDAFVGSGRQGCTKTAGLVESRAEELSFSQEKSETQAEPLTERWQIKGIFKVNGWETVSGIANRGRGRLRKA